MLRQSCYWAATRVSCILVRDMALQINATHTWMRVDDVLVGMTIEGEIDDAVWDKFLSDLDRDDVRVILQLTAPNSAGLSALQRKKAADIMKKKSMPAIVVTDSRMVRGILTAVSWLGAQVLGFSWSALEDAVKHTSSDVKTQSKLVTIARDFVVQTFKD